MNGIGNSVTDRNTIQNYLAYLEKYAGNKKMKHRK